MYHPYRKDSMHLRTALFKAYKGKCEYCGSEMKQRDMQVDHIIPVNKKEITDIEILRYIEELHSNSFVEDSIENYLPVCGACNLSKSNEVFTASNLRYYHEIARKHVKTVLGIIKKYDENEDVFYEPVDKSVWEELNFASQRDLSNAIMGYRLGERDVLACPRFSQVEQIENQLKIVDYVVIEGETGCGKSISIYQSAYDFYNEGWRVYRYKCGDFEGVNIPNNTELSLYLIDDAQKISEHILETLKMQARPNAKLLISKTVSSFVKQDTIFLTNKEAVNCIYEYYLKNKEIIIPIVHKVDKSIGVGYLEQPIEWRLNISSKAKTPWQFNYILRGGWKMMNEIYQTIYKHNNCGLLAALISAFQIMQLDQSVDFDWVCKKANEIDKEISWGKSDLDYLINKMIVLSEDDVRIIHMESAKVILANFLKNEEEIKRNLLFRIIEKVFLEKYISPLGIVWLCNGISSYYNNSFEKSLVTEKMIDSVLGCLDEYNSSDERMQVAVFWEMVFRYNYIRNGEYYFCKNQDIILNWIQNSDSKTCYAYSGLINTIINNNKKLHNNFTSKIDYIKLQELLLKEKTPNYYAWGKLFDRLLFSISKNKNAESIRISFSNLLDRLCDKANCENICGITHFFCSIYFLNENSVKESIKKLLPVYSIYLSKNINNINEIFDFDFLLYICGMNLLGNSRTSNVQKESSALIVSVVPENEMAEAISKGVPREWHSFCMIMYLIMTYDKNKAKRIVQKIDLESLATEAKDNWDKAFEISDLCEMIYLVDKRKAKRFIDDNLDNIPIMYSTITNMAPKTAIRAFKKGIEVELVTCDWWEYALLATKSLFKADREISLKIIMQNAPKLIEKINGVTALDFRDGYCLEFLKLIKNIAPIGFEEIIKGLDYEKIQNNWSKGYIEKRKEKIVEDRKKCFFEIIKNN